jgi:hypothetical protein
MPAPSQRHTYDPFPWFKAWSDLPVDSDRWDAGVREIRAVGDTPPEQLAEAFRLVRRAAAVDTGAIEGLYEVDRAFTFTVAAQAATWEAVLLARQGKRSDLIRDQLAAYELLVDLATEALPVSETLIRCLHADVCRSQETYTTIDAAGNEAQRDLPKGAYKQYPNNVVTVDGVLFEYCPVESTAPEMTRLVDELRSDPFGNAHPVVQAAYAHYALILIHPFPDGNGRVARLLASLYLCRAASIPLLVLAPQRAGYLKALRDTDDGQPQSLVSFVEACAANAFHLAASSLRAVALPTSEASAVQLRTAYISRAGLTFEELDRRIVAVVGAMHKRFTDSTIAALGDLGGLSCGLADSLQFPPKREGDRGPNKASRITYSAESRHPTTATVQGAIQFEMPRNPTLGETCTVRWQSTSPNRDAETLFEASIADLLQEDNPITAMKIEIAIERVVRFIVAELAEGAIRVRRQQGY